MGWSQSSDGQKVSDRVPSSLRAAGQLPHLQQRADTFELRDDGLVTLRQHRQAGKLGARLVREAASVVDGAEQRKPAPLPYLHRTYS